MFFNAEQTSGAVGAVIPEKSAHSTGPGQESKLNSQQFPGKGAPAEAGAEAGAGEAAAGAGAAEGAAGVSELLPLLALA